MSSPLPPPPPGAPGAGPPLPPSSSSWAELDASEPCPPAADGAEPAVRTVGLRKRYGAFHALDGVSLSVPVGATYGLVGPNGAGKSTTFAVLAGLLRPTSGAARVLGHDPVTEPHRVRARLGYMPDVLGVYDGLRVDEYLRFFLGAYKVPRRQWAAATDGLLELVGLEGKRTAMVPSLSRGMKQRLSLARALVHDPDVLVLDEPASGLDPRARVELRQLLVDLNGLGKTVVISSHVLADLEEICTHVAFLEAGRLLAEGSPGDILERLGGGRRVVVRFLDGSVETHAVADVEGQRDLVRQLVAEGRDVVEVTAEGGLEELFLKVTKGIVQ